MKVHIGLIYVGEQCRVQCLHMSRAACEKNLERAIARKVKNPQKLDITSHVITKSLKFGEIIQNNIIKIRRRKK